MPLVFVFRSLNITGALVQKGQTLTSTLHHAPYAVVLTYPRQVRMLRSLNQRN